MNSSRVSYQKTRKKSDYNNENFDDLSEFVGIVFDYDESKNGKIVIHYPKSLGDLDKTDNKKTLINLVKSLRLLKNADYEDKTYSNAIKNINIDKYPLYSYLWIWNDFKLHGRLLFNEMTDCKNSSGKINWKRTFQGSPLIYKDNIYYDEIIYRKKTIKENLLTEIYDYCVYKSVEMIFFLTNLSKNFVHPLYKDISRRKNEYVNCLKDAIEATFDDEKKLRYRHMLYIVDSVSFDSLINKNIVGVTSYASVFEKEIDMMLGNVRDISKYYPEAYMQVEGEKRPQGRLRQDTINICNDECFIIDSKFYEFGNMPATESIEKQIVYGENIELNNKFSKNNIYNVFLIPRCFDEEGWDSKDILKYLGYDYSGWKKNDKTYEFILIYFIDLEYVINNYRNGYNDTLFAKLHDDAINRIKNIKQKISI